MQEQVQAQDEVQTTDTPADDTDTIDFNAAVIEGKQILKQIELAERGQLRLGEIADKLEPKYGDRTLAKFAAEIGIDKTTLNNYRSVYRAWEGKLPPGVIFPSFTVLKELQNVEDRAELIKDEPTMSKRRAEVHRVLKDHPHREEIRSENPNLSCTRDARKLMEKYDGGNANEQATGERADFNETKRELRDQAALANKMIGAAEASKRCTPEQLRNLGKAAAAVPASLEEMERAGEEWLEHVTRLKQAAAEAKETAEAGGHIRRSPRAAPSELAQAAF
jgi:hypothetical protein